MRGEGRDGGVIFTTPSAPFPSPVKGEGKIFLALPGEIKFPSFKGKYNSENTLFVIINQAGKTFLPHPFAHGQFVLGGFRQLRKGNDVFFTKQIN